MTDQITPSRVTTATNCARFVFAERMLRNRRRRERKTAAQVYGVVAHNSFACHMTNSDKEYAHEVSRKWLYDINMDIAYTTAMPDQFTILGGAWKAGRQAARGKLMTLLREQATVRAECRIDGETISGVVDVLGTNDDLFVIVELKTGDAHLSMAQAGLYAMAVTESPFRIGGGDKPNDPIPKDKIRLVVVRVDHKPPLLHTNPAVDETILNVDESLNAAYNARRATRDAFKHEPNEGNLNKSLEVPCNTSSHLCTKCAIFQTDNCPESRLKGGNL